MATETLSEAEFERLADDELNRLVEALIEVGEELDPDLQMGVLSIQFDDGSKYVVNSHRAARQIWMAAERRAWHFDYHRDTSKWIAGGDELWSALAGALGRKLGRDLTL
jgi:iron-sulfur cluster assembly protein CyaY